MNEVIWLSDLHIPYEDKGMVKKVLQRIENDEPDIVVLGGDIVDFISPSQFNKHPYEEGTLQKELNHYYKFMDKLREVHNGKIVYLIGNHETRVDKYLKKNHELHGLDVLKLDYLLKCDEYNVDLVYEWTYKGMLFKHGTYCNKYSANKELEVNGISGISGHVHRHSVASKTDRTGEKVWISAPCLQDIRKQEFYHGDNWQTGYVVLYFEGRKLDSYEVNFL